MAPRRRRTLSATPHLLGPTGSIVPTFADVLDRLDRWLYRRRRRMRLALRPGLDAAGCALLRAALPTVPADLLTLLCWHDGQNDDFRGTFADGWCLLSAAEIAALTADLDSDPPPGWHCGWFPFARDASDSFLAVDPTAVRVLWSGRPESEVLVSSLPAWFATLLADFEAGRYVEDPERGDFLNTGRPRPESDQT